MINILPSRKNYLAYIGMNTMPVYILHLIVRYEVKKYGITFGILPDNWVVYYLMIFGLASLCVVVFSSRPVSRGYDWIIDKLYYLFMKIVKQLLRLMGLMDRGYLAWAKKTMDLTERQQKK